MNREPYVTATEADVPPVMEQASVILSRPARFGVSLHELLTGDFLCLCEWRPNGIYFGTRHGELLMPLSEISAIWRLEVSNLPIYEIQIANKSLPEWRFVLRLAAPLQVGVRKMDDLKLAVLEANPEASIVPLPERRSDRVRGSALS
ncbi:MAG TPA: hypothetical protein VMB21_15165 [Candidatus Limnocylindria bacterium]|jgi:hypothetical protein|nr:hypothetical protein [Candidatus Limnocylindria bacterium]